MPDFSNWSVVIIDDEPENIGVLELVFRFHKIASVSVNSGAACLQLVNEIDPPTLLIVDIQMPQMSGYELLNILRKHETWGSLPMIAVTAHALEQDQEKILQAGFDGYIPKPINVMSFINEVSSIVGMLEK